MDWGFELKGASVAWKGQLDELRRKSGECLGSYWVGVLSNCWRLNSL